MSYPEEKKQLKFSSGACYRIGVKGYLDDSWSERFSDMRISNQTDGIVSPLAVLEGSVMDQTELIGVLNNLYEMHLPLVSVTFLDD
jgi:hypothetical protein